MSDVATRVIRDRLARREAERDRLQQEHAAAKQRLMEVESAMITTTMACAELTEALAELEAPVSTNNRRAKGGAHAGS